MRCILTAYVLLNTGREVTTISLLKTLNVHMFFKTQTHSPQHQNATNFEKQAINKLSVPCAN